jgi:hypothetical protein
MCHSQHRQNSLAGVDVKFAIFRCSLRFRMNGCRTAQVTFIIISKAVCEAVPDFIYKVVYLTKG